MKSVDNLRAMFAATADIYRQSQDNEIVEHGNIRDGLEALKLMLAIHEVAHKQALAMTEHEEKYIHNWQRITPQGKSYDALPE